MGNITRGLHYRLRVIRQYAAGHRNGVGVWELLSKMLSRPNFVKAKRLISGVEKKDGFWAVTYAGFDSPLYFPGDLDLIQLYQITIELLDPDDWHYYTVPETPVLEDDIVVDCGAAAGLFTYLYAGRCRKVYAIDPSPTFIETMEMTFSGFSNVEIIPAALSDREGLLHLSAAGIHSRLTEDDGIPVKVETLDNLFYNAGKPITFIKADLEGYDVKALLGARKLIGKYLPKIAITTYHHASHAKQISDYLRDIHPGYQIRVKGVSEGHGEPIMLHAWVKQRPPSD
jgi:FkbM family methyltransferase